MSKTIKYAALCSLSALLAACGGERPADVQTMTASRASAQMAQVQPASAWHNVVQHIYVGYFGRPADAGGLEFFSTRFRELGAPTSITGMSAAYGDNMAGVRALVDVFGTSEESQALYAGDNSAFFDAVYRNLFGRAPDADGKAWWVARMNAGDITRASAAVAIMAGALDSDRVAINQKTAVAGNFTTALTSSRHMLAYDGLAANVVVRNMLGNVTGATDPAAFQPNVTATLDTLVANLGPQGMYAGKLTGNGSLFNSLVLEDGQYWGFYSASTTGTLNPVGFVHGLGSASGGKFMSQDIKDFGPRPAVAGNISADYTGMASFGGVINMPNATNPNINFTGAVLDDATYRYLALPQVTDLAGTHNVGGTLGTHVMQIGANGVFSGTAQGCNYSGTLAPRASRRNVFNVSWTFGAGTCSLAGQTGTGIAYSYMANDGGSRQFVIAAYNAARSAGWLAATASGQPTQLIVTDTVAGSGAAAAPGNILTVHYTGWLYSATAAGNRGAKFDSSVDRGAPFTFQLGVSNVIPGWQQGMAGMRVGGKRILTIPSHLGYGVMGSPPAIPSNAGLVFEVELLQMR